MNLKKTFGIMTGITTAVAGVAHVMRKKAEKTSYTAELMDPIEHREMGFYEKYVKRGLDVACAAGALCVFSPLYLGIAVLVKIKLGSPVLFTQDRPGLIGKDGKETVFKMYKFRTMTDEKDAKGNLLPDEQRLTSFGKKLRATSLDELPEAINILNGTMSVIGPRPQLVRDMVFMSKKQRRRHTSKPGLSGLAQVSGRNAISWENKLDKDLEYIDAVGFNTDLRIIGKTVKKAFLEQEGITEENHATADDYGDYLLSTGTIDSTRYNLAQEMAQDILERKITKGHLKIWLINHYAVPPQYYPLARPSLFAKNLIKMGHEVTIIAASTIHNSKSENLIEGKEYIKHITDEGVPYVLINCTPYEGNGINRVKNILEFAQRLPKVLDTLEKPDAIVATSFDPLTCYQGITYGKKHRIKTVAEIADLWPETLIAYSGVSKRNPIVKVLRAIEKRIYLYADEIVFTMEGAYKYVESMHWQQIVPESKVHFINNGIDLEQFDANRNDYVIDDEDLNEDDKFKVVYTGSIRKVNNLGALLEVAKKVKNDRIKFLIWGDGDELDELKHRVDRANIKNVVFKGKVEKKYIPYITSKADLNLVHNSDSLLFKYGISFNKLFDYLAAGKPILCDFWADSNPAVLGGAAIMIDSKDIDGIAMAIESVLNMDKETYQRYCDSARQTAMKYDFKELTTRLVDIIRG